MFVLLMVVLRSRSVEDLLLHNSKLKVD